MKGKAILKDTMTADLSKRIAALKKLPKEALKVWTDNTPKASGNARRKTVLRDNTIEAKYPYASNLDNGSSSQSPNGMSEPTEKFLKQRTKQILTKRK